MLLSSIVGKQVLSESSMRGLCVGVGISLKTLTVKYLLCTNQTDSVPSRFDFALPFSCVRQVDELCIHVGKARAVTAGTCARIFPQKPVFTFDGAALGTLRDVRFSLCEDGNFTADELYTSEGRSFSVGNVYAFSDAVILKKERPYPIGQRIPAPMLSQFGAANQTVVTKTILKRAIDDASLIRLTLSLPPFRCFLG